MEILEDKENFLMDRREVKVEVDAEKTPSFVEASEMLTKEFKVDKDLICIKKIEGRFGTQNFIISAFIYKDKQAKERFEPKPKEKKKEKGGAETEKQEEAGGTAEKEKTEKNEEKPAEGGAGEEKKEEEKKE